MDPATLAIVSTVASVGSTVMGFIGAEKKGQAESDAANYSAAVARNNQLVAERNTQIVLQQGQVAEQNQRMKTAQEVSAMRAGAAASGVDVSSGSPLRGQMSVAGTGELDALTIRNNYARQAYGYAVAGTNYGSQSTLDSMTASNAKTAGDFNAVASLIGGASSVSDKWLKYKQVGVPISV